VPHHRLPGRSTELDALFRAPQHAIAIGDRNEHVHRCRAVRAANNLEGDLGFVLRDFRDRTDPVRSSAVGDKDALTYGEAPDAHMVGGVATKDDHGAFDKRRAWREESS
jgi:hypothetical protein